MSEAAKNISVDIVPLQSQAAQILNRADKAGGLNISAGEKTFLNQIVEAPEKVDFTIAHEILSGLKTRQRDLKSTTTPDTKLYAQITSFTKNLEKQMDNGQVFELLFEDTNAIGFVAYELNCNFENFSQTLTKIHKIYMLPEMQGKGFGKFMIDEIVRIAKSNNQKGVFLNVNKYNKAKIFYQKLGFVISKEEVIDIGNGYVMDDYVMEYLF
jgi:ribosomal protein S18 acetylase RimI-like enzyme